MTYEPEYAACVDCLMLLANGETPPEMNEEETEAFLAKVNWSPGEGYHWVYNCPEDCSPWFSMTPCDVCRRPLGGDRHPVALLEI